MNLVLLDSLLTLCEIELDYLYFYYSSVIGQINFSEQNISQLQLTKSLYVFDWINQDKVI